MEILGLIALIVSIFAYNKANSVEKAFKQSQGTGISQKPFQDQSFVSAPRASQSAVVTPQSGEPAQALPVSGNGNAFPSQQESHQLFSSPKAVPTISQEPDVVMQFMHWLSVDWLMKVGAALLFLGVSWIVSITVWDSIGPIGRVLVGILIGSAILIFGHLRIIRYVNQGTVLEGLGAGVLLFTTYVAQINYHLFPPTMALGFLFLVSVFVAFSSVVNKSQTLALLGIVLGAMAPFLIGSKGDFFGLFSYLFIISLGTLWVVHIRGWRPLIFANFAVYFFYSLPYIIFGIGGKISMEDALSVAFAFAILFFLSNIWVALKSEKMEQADMITASANALLLLGWINAYVPDDWKGLVTAICALAFSFGAVLVYRIRGNGIPIMLYSTVTGMMFGAATVFQFSGPILVMVLTLEIGTMVTTIIAYSGIIDNARQMMYLFLIPIFLSLGNVMRYSTAREVFTTDFFALLLLGAVIFSTARLFASLKDDAKYATTYNMFMIIGSIYFLLLIWFGFGNALYPDKDMVEIISLVIYTIIGLSLYIPGRHSGVQIKMYEGIALLVFVVAYLLLVSVWQMDTIGRIITFSSVGILLMSTAFIGRPPKN